MRSDDSDEELSSNDVQKILNGANDDEELTRTLELECLVETSPIDYDSLRRVAAGRPLPATVRARCWPVLLGVAGGSPRGGEQDFDELYNLPEQFLIRRECNAIFDTLGNPESDRSALTGQLEAVLTRFCKQRHTSYTQDNGWRDVLTLLCALGGPVGLVRRDMYAVFNAIVTKYIAVGDAKAYDLYNCSKFSYYPDYATRFRLLLLYHEPQLCSFLDTHKITPDLYAKRWFTSIFASVTDIRCSLPLWDVYLQQGDPFAVFFMALVMLVNAKETILSMKAVEERKQLIETIANFPSQLNASDIEDFCQLAQYYSSCTPQSFRRDYHGPLFGANLAVDEFADVTVHSLLCLPVSVQELLAAQKAAIAASAANADPSMDDIHYFVVDARPTAQYMYGHLPGAFNLDATLLVHSPLDYATAVEALVGFKHRKWPAAHMCFMGAGDMTDDDTAQYVHMVVAQFLQRGEARVSLARGGYRAVHDQLREALSTRLKSHSTRHCSVCMADAHTAHTSPKRNPSAAARTSPVRRRYSQEVTSVDAQATTATTPPTPTTSLVNKFRGALTVASKSYLEPMRDKLVDYVVNADNAWTQADGDVRHVNPSQRNSGITYRNVSSVFTIDDEDDDDDDDANDNTASSGNHRTSAKSPTVQVCAQNEPLVLIHKLLQSKSADGASSHVATVNRVPINLNVWLRENNVDTRTHCFEAQHVEADTKLLRACQVAVTGTHLYIFYKRSPSPKDATAPGHEMYAKRALVTIFKITSKKKLPELLTIKYGYELSYGEYKVTRTDRLLAPKAGDLAKAIKSGVVAMRMAPAPEEHRTQSPESIVGSPELAIE